MTQPEDDGVDDELGSVTLASRSLGPARYRCMTKATNREAGAPRHSLNWVVSRRAVFRVFDDAVQCGDWIIRSKDVTEAVLFEARQFLIPALVLQVTTQEKTYQFGFNPWVRVAEHLPFPFRRERLTLGYSPFSVVLRVLLAAYVAYLMWKWLAAD